MSNDYEIRFKCWNCLEEFTKQILKGRCAKNNSGICPYCEVKSSSTNKEDMHKVLSCVNPNRMKF